MWSLFCKANLKVSRLIGLWLISWLLTGCATSAPQTATPDVTAISTAAVATVYANLTEFPSITFTPMPTPDPCARTQSPTAGLHVIYVDADQKSYFQMDEAGQTKLLAEDPEASQVGFFLAPDLKKAVLLTRPQNSPETMPLSNSGYAATSVTAVELGNLNRTSILNLDPLADLPPDTIHRYIGKVIWSPGADQILVFEYLYAPGRWDDLTKLYLYDFPSSKLTLLAGQNGPRAELLDLGTAGWLPDGRALLFQSKEKYLLLENATLQETVFNLADLKVGSLEEPGLKAYLPETNQFLISNDYATPKGTQSQLYLTSMNGPEPIQVTWHESYKTVYGWSLDRKKFSYTADERLIRGEVPPQFSLVAAHTGGMRAWIGVADLETGQETIFERSPYYFEILFSPNSQKVAIALAGPPDTVTIFSFQDQTQVTLPAPDTTFAWSPDSRDLFFRGDDQRIVYLDTCDLQFHPTTLVVPGYGQDFVFTK